LPREFADKEIKGGRFYDPTAGSMMAILRYGSGMPLNRLSVLQKNLGIPLAVSTIWDKIKETTTLIIPLFEALQQLAAQGRIIHNDDTGMKILQVMKQIAQEKEFQKKQGKRKNTVRTGIFTTSIIAQWQSQKIALFFTGRRHAGENLSDLLKRREPGRSPPIQMSDAKSGNTPDDVDTITSCCNAHARRKFVEVAEDFPDECLHVIVDVFSEIYRVDAVAQKENLSENERLKLHRETSGPIMKAFHGWMNGQFEEKRVEPNSGLGKAISYVLKHWEQLTRFLEVPGVPLDNNINERAVKMAILNRKNSLFYKTEQGARVGDLFMSLIHTCRLNDKNPFDYLTQLQVHADMVHQDPYRWLPWNYQETLVLLERCCA
jgi:transposase